MTYQFTDNQIRTAAGHAIYFKGKDYFLERRVQDVIVEDNVLVASVRGSQEFPYKVRVYLKCKTGLYSECTCLDDAADLCKHAVAALFALQANPKQATVKVVPKVTKTVLKKSSLLFLNHNHQTIKPVIRFYLPVANEHGWVKSININTVIAWGEKINEVTSLSQIVDVQDYRYDQDSDLPALDQFNQAQVHCLRLMHSLEQVYSTGTLLKNYELSLLLRESDDPSIEFYMGKQKMIISREHQAGLNVHVAKEGKEEIKATFAFVVSNHEAPLKGILIAGRPSWLLCPEQGIIVPFHPDIPETVLTKVFAANQEMSIPVDGIVDFYDTIINPLYKHATITFADKKLEQIHLEEQALHVDIHLDGGIKQISADVRFTYGQHTYSIADLIYAPAYLPLSGSHHWLKRDLDEERAVVRFLTQDCGFVLDKQHLFIIKGTDTIAEVVFNKFSAIDDKWTIHYSSDLNDIFHDFQQLTPTLQVGSSSEIDWFYFNVQYKAKGVNQEITQQDIRRQLVGGKNYIQLKSGQFVGIAKNEFAAVEHLIEEFDGKVKNLSVYHVPFLIDEAGRQGIKIDVQGSLKEWHEHFRQFRSIKTVDAPKEVKTILRDYQHKGLDWLNFLREYRLGGILADEMGLGKTLQVLSLIKLDVDQGQKAPNLVVCPTTLVFNWQAEIQKFFPDLKVLIPQGSDRREQLESMNEYHVVITSYALLRRDAEIYEKSTFNYLILDEAQHIKNRYTLNARMSKQLKSKYRLVLTGTPIENSVADLWSIFDFLMPGFLGGYDRFKERYELPILRDQDQHALSALARKIKPFMLRRLKKDVIKELPEKIEQVSWCELEPTQAKTYQQMLLLAQREVMDAYKTQGFNKSRLKILTVILRLRQICCHPQLANVDLGHRLLVSAKLNLLKEMIQESISGGHKVLIFSQFIGMLSIISEYLKKENINFDYMDGSTDNRGDVVNHFNNTPETKVFLLSLKVGGVGLNLTSADTVIIYEPWWNPAVEDQAIDRAHRIGQASTVNAYRLICKGTIEEKILDLQRRKKNLIDSLIISEEGIAKKLGWEDVKFLLDIN